MTSAKETTLRVLRTALGNAEDDLYRCNLQIRCAPNGEVLAQYTEYAVDYQRRVDELKAAIAAFEHGG